jgi:hypothetical protein
VTPTNSVTPTISVTPSVTATSSVTPTVTSSLSVTATPTHTPTPSVTPNLVQRISLDNINSSSIPITRFQLGSISTGESTQAYNINYYYSSSTRYDSNEQYYIKLDQGKWKLFDGSNQEIDQISTDSTITNVNGFAQLNYANDSYDYTVGYTWLSQESKFEGDTMQGSFSTAAGFIKYDGSVWKLYDAFSNLPIETLTNSDDISDTVNGVDIFITSQLSPTPTVTPTQTMSMSITNTASQAPSVTPTLSTTPTITPTITPTPTPTTSCPECLYGPSNQPTTYHSTWTVISAIIESTCPCLYTVEYDLGVSTETINGVSEDELS